MRKKANDKLAAMVKPPKHASDDVKVLKRVFLASFEVYGNVGMACKAAGIERKRHQQWKDDDTDYKLAFADAQKTAADRLEQEARRRAVEGIIRPKFFKGEMIMIPDGKKTIVVETENVKGEIVQTRVPKMVPYLEHEYSDNLLMFLLRGARPEKFGPTVSNPDPVPPKQYVNLTDDDFGSESREQTLSADRSLEDALSIERS